MRASGASATELVPQMALGQWPSERIVRDAHGRAFLRRTCGRHAGDRGAEQTREQGILVAEGVVAQHVHLAVPWRVANVMTPRLSRKRRMRLLARWTTASTSSCVGPGAPGRQQTSRRTPAGVD